MDDLLELLDTVKEGVGTMKKGVESALEAVKAGDVDEAQELLEALLGDGPEEAADDEDEDDA